MQPGAVLKVGEVEIAIRPSVRNVEVLPSDKTWFGAAIGQSLSMRTHLRRARAHREDRRDGAARGRDGHGQGRAGARALDRERAGAGAVRGRRLRRGELLAARERALRARARRVHGGRRGAAGRLRAGRRRHGVPRRDRRAAARRAAEAAPRARDASEFRRVGGNRTLKSDVRVIAATKRNLLREVQGGKFREDLYFRLAVVPITVPSLRARREDIPMLVEHILKASGGGLDGERRDDAGPGRPRLARQHPRAAERARPRDLHGPRNGAGELSIVSLPMSGTGAGGRLPLRAGPELPRDAREVRHRVRAAVRAVAARAATPAT